MLRVHFVAEDSGRVGGEFVSYFYFLLLSVCFVLWFYCSFLEVAECRSGAAV